MAEASGYLFAFLVGGAISAIAQLLLDLTRLSPARILVLYVVLGVFLGAVGVYRPLTELAGAGATVPLTGFGATVAKGTREAILERGPIGILTGPLSAAAGGTTAALLFSYVAAMLCHSRAKRATTKLPRGQGTAP